MSLVYPLLCDRKVHSKWRTRKPAHNTSTNCASAHQAATHGANIHMPPRTRLIRLRDWQYTDIQAVMTPQRTYIATEVYLESLVACINTSSFTCKSDKHFSICSEWKCLGVGVILDEDFSTSLQVIHHTNHTVFLAHHKTVHFSRKSGTGTHLQEGSKFVMP